MSANAALYSSASDNWPTPQDFYDRLDAKFGFTLDVCSSTANHKAPRYYALDHADAARRDGLACDWAADVRTHGGAVWMNPPYGRTIGAWMSKAHATARAGATVVCLVPARTSSAWWHDLVLMSGAEVLFVRGRLTFGEAKTSAPFASAVVIYRPTDAAGSPGPVGVIDAKAPTKPHSAPAPAGADPAADVAAYIEGFTPRRLPTRTWGLCADPVRELVRGAGPHGVATARLYLSQLVGYLTDGKVWDGASTPDLDALLVRASINDHVTRTRFANDRTRGARRDTLYRLARVRGLIDPVAPRRVPTTKPDAFLLAGATVPVPVATLVAARKQLPDLSADALKPVSQALAALALDATDESRVAGTVMAWATLRSLTKAPNQEPVVSTQTSRSDAKASTTPATTRPASRRARIAAAKAALAAHEAALAAEKRGTGPQAPPLPDGTGIAEDVAARVRAFAPQKKVRAAWATNSDLAAGLVFAYQPSSARNAQTICSYVALFLTWLTTRPGHTRGTPFEVGDVLAPGLVDAWIDAMVWSDRSKATARCALRRALRNLDPDSAHLRLEHHKTAAPYTPAEADWFARAAWHQPTTAQTRDLCLVVGLGLGAGLDPRDLRHLTRESFTTVRHGDADLLFVSVPGNGARGRTVPVRDTYQPLVQRGLDMHERTGKAATDLLLGKVADRNNVVGPVRRRARTAESTPFEVRMARLRNTWLVAQMCSPVSLADLLRAAGLASARTVTELLAYCPEPSAAERDRVLTMLAGAR